MRSLESILDDNPTLLSSIEILVWDNSPEKLEDIGVPFPCRYKHSTRNRGVAGAYNEALKLAVALKCPWLLLLDQDTRLPANFLSRMLQYSFELQANLDVASIGPSIWVKSRHMFPRRVRFNRTEACDPSFVGVNSEEYTTANSGVLMRVAALQEIGGYNENFSLEFSDVYVFHQLHRIDKRMWIAGDIRLDHEIAIADYGGAMTPQRYRSFVIAEDAFISLYKSKMENIAQTVRLFARSIKQYIQYPDKTFARVSLEYCFRRLFISKSSRIQSWSRHLLP
jgi:GT2 family glycosyltransferase